MIAASNALGTIVLIGLVPILAYQVMKLEVKRDKKQDEKLKRYEGGKFNTPARKLGQKMSRKK